MLILGEDIKRFFKQTPEDNCREFLRRVIESVRSDGYLRFITDEEKAITDEANRDELERPSGKKKRRKWRRGQ
jgi:hypothetical protein